jgi:hypothetical protein
MAATDILSIDEARTAVGIELDNLSHDDLLYGYVSAISLQLDQRCGPVVIRTVTGELHDGGGSVVFLKHNPVSTVTTVTEYSHTTAQALAAESNTVKTASDYKIDLETGALRRRSSNRDAYFPAGRDNVVVTYAAGRYASTTVVADKWKLAAGICLANIWRREQGAGTKTFGGEGPPGVTFMMPNAAKDLLFGEFIAPLI